MKKLLAALFFLAPFGALAQNKPNVLFIAVDDLNAWVGHLGRNPQAQTPNIDRLASRGVTFSKAYCAVPACEPSRCALMSGQRPWTSACYSNGDNWRSRVPEGQQLNAQFLKAGYHVAGAGKIYHGDTYFPSEWTEYFDSKGLTSAGKGVAKDEGFHEPVAHDLKDEDLMDWQVVNWCIEQLNQDHGGKPFFVACGLHKPHLPFVVPKKYYDQFPLETIQLPPHREDDLNDVPPAGVKMARPEGDHAKFLESGRWRAAIQSYLASCAYTDMNVGRLLDALDKSPAKDNTIIVFWGDHGWSFGEKQHWRKFALWEEPTRAPLIWVAPGVTKAGGVCERPVDFMTIFPTLCELANLPVPAYVEGPSAVSLLKDPKAAWDHVAITTHGYMNHAVRDERWRYIRYANGDEELYDHAADPYEWTNQAANAEFASVKSGLMAKLPTQNAPQDKKAAKGSEDEGGAPKKGKKRASAKE